MRSSRYRWVRRRVSRQAPARRGRDDGPRRGRHRHPQGPPHTHALLAQGRGRQPCADVQDAPHQDYGLSGSCTRSEVPSPRGLVIAIDPPTASTRSASPVKPDPSAGSAPPTPSSSILSSSAPPVTLARTSTSDAEACFATFVSASETT